jgi:hypothetical protein
LRDFRFYQPFGLAISGRIYVPLYSGTELSLALRKVIRFSAGKENRLFAAGCIQAGRHKTQTMFTQTRAVNE